MKKTKGTPVVFTGPGWNDETTGFGEYYSKARAQRMKTYLENRGCKTYIKNRGKRGYTLFLDKRRGD
jgi:hypothetical protein